MQANPPLEPTVSEAVSTGIRKKPHYVSMHFERGSKEEIILDFLSFKFFGKRGTFETGIGEAVAGRVLSGVSLRISNISAGEECVVLDVLDMRY